MNVGGGLGIAYAAGDEPPSIEEYVDVNVDARRGRLFDPLPKILFEPGRSLVGNAGITALLGRDGQGDSRGSHLRRRRRRDVRQPAADALRLAYEALIANRAGARPAIDRDDRRQALRVRRRPGPRRRASPTRAPGDVLAIPATGAYGYAMANNYNGVPRPPVVFCCDGEAPAGRPPRDLRGPDRPRCLMSEPGEIVRIGLLGRGTVGGAFARAAGRARRGGRRRVRPPARDHRRAASQRGRLRRDPRRTPT